MRERKRKQKQCSCQLCSREREIGEIRSQRRELSLASIYRKDFKANDEGVEQEIMPQCSARKNQSSNIKEKSHSYLQINSTYLANFKPTPRVARLASPARQKFREPDILESYLSTYSDAHRKLPVLSQESYKIADPSACSPAIPFAKLTEYSKNYQLSNSPKEQKISQKDHNFQDGVKIFETTQKAAYTGRKIRQERARGPSDNMAPLPTSPFLYKSTYRQDFISRPSAPNPQSHEHCHIDLYRF